ncbi:MAG: hypothetical protein AAF202_00555 [Pseudomonadota bacterium]
MKIKFHYLFLVALVASAPLAWSQDSDDILVESFVEDANDEVSSSEVEASEVDLDDVEELPGEDVEPSFQEPEETVEIEEPSEESVELEFYEEPEETVETPEFEVPEEIEAAEQMESSLPKSNSSFDVKQEVVQEEDDLNITSGRARLKTGERKIRHPLAPRGLIRITKDKTYVYRTNKSLQDRAISVRAGLFEPTALENPDTGTSFSDSYSTTRGPIVFFDYEWNWLRGSLGRIGYKLGTGVFTTQGNGQFKDFEDFPENGDRDVPKEVFTFAAFPNSASLVYRFQISDKQTIVPYVDGGLMAITFFELRDDQDFPKVGLAPAGFFSGGLAFSLESLDSLAILGLDREYGINDIYLTVEFRQILNVGSDYDFTASALNGGFLLEF